MYEEEIHFRKLFLKQFETVLEHLMLTKIKRVPLLRRMDVWSKSEEVRSRRSPVIDRKVFFGTFDLSDLDPVTQKSIGFICYPGWMCGPSLKRVGQGILELLIGKDYRRTDQTD